MTDDFLQLLEETQFHQKKNLLHRFMQSVLKMQSSCLKVCHLFYILGRATS